MPREATVADIRERLPRRLEARPQGRWRSTGTAPRRAQPVSTTTEEKAAEARDKARRRQPRARSRRRRRGPDRPGPRRRLARPRSRRRPPCGDEGPAASRAAAGHPAEPDAQVRHPGPRGLPDGRLLRRRPARRAVHHDGQGGLDGRWPDGRDRHAGVDGPAIRRAAGGLRQQVRPPAASSRPASRRTPTSRSPRA